MDLPSVVLAAIDAMRPAVRAREIELNVSTRVGHARRCWGDADRLQQVMWNLLSNAVKFTPPSGRDRGSVEETARRVQITVADNGVGIDSAFLPHVFERFRQADSSTTRIAGGTRSRPRHRPASCRSSRRLGHRRERRARTRRDVHRHASHSGGRGSAAGRAARVDRPAALPASAYSRSTMMPIPAN